jgi:hypothetical protein
LGFTEKCKKYTLYFDKMYQQSNWGDRFEALVTDKVYHLHWQVNHPGFDYDIWVDDVRLVECTGSPVSSGG